ncbi:lipolytic protein G-D-S-L family [Actinobacteria bacterium OK074]|nr:lipolytic protein G-D-S-L family [Actinobacteria bacterium OK074]
MPEPSRRGRRVRAVGAVAVAGTVLLGAAACDDPTGAAAKPSASATTATGWNTAPDSVAAVGDSITRGFDACTVLADCPKVSWSTGSDPTVDSLAVRLLGENAAANSWNYAATGARMADLTAQMRKAAAREPELVTVMAGANDACRSTTAAMTSVADFRADFEQALTTLRKASPKSQVYVASVPNLKRLWSQGRTSELGRQVWKLGICPSMLGDAESLSAAANLRRETVQARVEAYNKVLKDVCATDRLCRFDGDAVFDYRFTTTQLSQWDWFHPSTDGQARLAEIAYRNVTAKKPVTS